MASGWAGPGARGTLVRLAPAGAVFLVLLTMSVLWAAGFRSTYFDILSLWGVRPFAVPFIDIAGTLAALDCARLGLDVLAVNPCDMMQRVHDYSPLLLVFAHTPLGQGQTLAVGFLLAAVFVLGLAALPPARDTSELLLRLAAALSTTVVFAVERANIDLLLFVLLVFAAHAVTGDIRAKRAGYALVLLAAALKYYPIVAMALALREPPARMLRVVLASAAAIAAFVFIYGAEITRTLAHVPAGRPFGDVFGLKNLPGGAYEELLRVMPASAAAAATMLVMIALVVFLLIGAIYLWRHSDIPAALARLDPAKEALLLIGAFVIAGCFVAEQNVGYRAIFFLVVLPGLWALGRDRAFAARRVMQAASWLSVVLMWEQAFRSGLWPPTAEKLLPAPTSWMDISAWMVKELGYWTLLDLFCVLALAYVVRTPVISRLRHRSVTA
jgi:hypothetical protein